MRRAVTMLAIQLLGLIAFLAMIGSVFVLLVAAGHTTAIDVAISTLEVSYD